MDFELKQKGKFNYVDEGEGHPVILLHGLMGGLSNFDSVINALSKNNFRVIAPSLPMYELPIIKTNIKSFNKFLHQFTLALDLKHFTLLGNSLGGHISLLYTKSYPERVHSVILTGSSGLYEKSMGNSFPKRGNYEFIKKKTEDVFYDSKIATKEIVDEVFELVNNKNKVIRTLAVAKSAIRHNMATDLVDMRMPFCIIWGRNDTVTPPEVAEEFHRLLPYSDLFWIDKCGHAPMMEHPEEFNELLLKWLNKFDTLSYS